jgi:hypothetical protein
MVLSDIINHIIYILTYLYFSLILKTCFIKNQQSKI